MGELLDLFVSESKRLAEKEARKTRLRNAGASEPLIAEVEEEREQPAKREQPSSLDELDAILGGTAPPPKEETVPVSDEEKDETVGTYPCTECGRFLYHRPTVCFWCRPKVGA